MLWNIFLLTLFTYFLYYYKQKKYHYQKHTHKACHSGIKAHFFKLVFTRTKLNTTLHSTQHPTPVNTFNHSLDTSIAHTFFTQFHRLTISISFFICFSLAKCLPKMNTHTMSLCLKHNKQIFFHFTKIFLK